MPYCKNCGQKVNEKAIFCPECGKRIEENHKKNPTDLDVEQNIKVQLSGEPEDTSEVLVHVEHSGEDLLVEVRNSIVLGTIIKAKGRGRTAEDGRCGDLLLYVTEIESLDIEICVSVKLAGMRSEKTEVMVYVPHLGKNITVYIPNNIKVGQRIRLKGIGLKGEAGDAGNLYVKVVDIDNKDVSGTPEEQLNSLIGLKEIKQDINNMINLVRIQTRRKNEGFKTVPISKHCVFTGNPGTGKTTVARIVADIYKEMGILSKGQLVEVTRTDLVGQYIGETAIKTQKKIEEALGGILFIDEAYTLIKDGKDFGQESIDTILKAMEDYREDFIVIVAGYEDLMQTFIDSNPGLKSRFNKYIYFSDYSESELEEIFYLLCDKYQYNLSEGAKNKLRDQIHRIVLNKSRNFANARDIRNLFETVITNQATRLANNKEGNIMLITEEDFGV